MPPLAIPPTLHDSLMARLDRLGAVKDVAQIGAVIGREFDYELLAAVVPVDEAGLRDALYQLAEAELIFGQGAPPQASYVFKHALVRDTAYESLLKSKRRQLHASIVGALEERLPETARAQPELLARHSAQAGLFARAIDYWLKAGQQAVARSAMVEAIAQLNEGLELLPQLPVGPARHRQELELQTALGGALIAAKGWAAEETGEAFARARELCREMGDTPQLFPVMVGQWSFHANRGELDAARAVAEELLCLAQQRQDLAAQVMAHRALGSVLLYLGELSPARMHLEQALAFYEPVHHRSLAFHYAHLDPRVAGLNWLAWLLFVLGYPEQALSRTREALAFARELSHPTTTGIGLYQAAGLCQFFRDRGAVLERAEELISLATEQGYPQQLALGTILRGWALAAGGEVEAGSSQLREGLAAYRATGGRVWLPYFLALLAEVHGRTGKAAEALDLLAEALACVERTGERWFEAELHRHKGEALLALDRERLVEVEACYRRATEIARKQGARVWELRAATSLARMWRDQGRRAAARDLLAPLYARFTEGLHTPDLVEAKALLDAG